MSVIARGPLDEYHQSSFEDNSTSYSSDENDQSWISWFCSLKGNEFFCEVDEEYIQDDFNLSGLSSMIPYYDYALDMILDIESPNGSKLTEQQHELVESAAELLYGLIHARYILSSRGMISMLEKYKQSHFGRCPRVACNNQSCLPVGTSDVFRTATLKIFCPSCQVIIAYVLFDLLQKCARIYIFHGISFRGLLMVHILEPRFLIFSF